MATLGLYGQELLDRQIRENQRQMAYSEILRLGGGVDPEIKYKKEYERINQMVSKYDPLLVGQELLKQGEGFDARELPLMECELWMPHGICRKFERTACGDLPCGIPTIQRLAAESYKNSSIRNVPMYKKLLLLEEVV